MVEPGPLVVHAPAELDSASAPELRDGVAALFASGVRHLVIDMANTTFVDSSGIGALIALTKRARTIGVQLEVRNVGHTAATTFRVSGAASVLPLKE